ncbi:MAG: hypothetical protein KA388_00210 [Rhodocyclaceae bacterium]|nr:hypothetical protein [Rhodocyclaceae bacterium]MBP6278188.1 hypothetical protein [Rhodocyclaceae bacterium]
MKIKAQLMLDDGEKSLAIPLPSAALTSLICELPDSPAYADIYDYLSRHSNSDVRKSVASKQFLPRATTSRLIEDPVIGVVAGLLDYAKARKDLCADEVLAICRRDSSLASEIARSCQNFACDDAVFELLETHPDESVRANLAWNARGPVGVLQRMAQGDSDSGVRDNAKLVLGA